MSIKKSLLPAALAAALTVTLVSAVFAQTSNAPAASVQKPVPPTAPAVAPVAPPAVAVPLAGHAAETHVRSMAFKALTPAEQAHIAITHERAARARYEQDTHNIDNMPSRQNAELKQELTAWFSALPLSREIELKRRDEILFGSGTASQKQKKPTMPFTQTAAPPPQTAAPAAP